MKAGSSQDGPGRFRRTLRPDLGVAVLLAALAAAAPAARAVEAVTGTEAVASKVAKDYVRVRLADGTFRPETYAFGKGGRWGGEIKDDSIDKVDFLDVAHVLAPTLASRNYLPAREPGATDLLIMVYWGTTAVPPPYENDPLYNDYQRAIEQYNILMEQGDWKDANMLLSQGLQEVNVANHMRDQTDFKNAALIGYDASGLVGTDQGRYVSHGAFGIERNEEQREIEENRYFVVLMAYDFRLLWKEKKHKLLWETRFSINENHNRFDAALPALARYASAYYGQPTQGLVKSRIPEGNVRVGDPTLIEFLTERK
jgi:hypothetical protein